MFNIERNILGQHSGRDGHKPIVIVNHITDGAFGSVVNTFQNLANNVSSTFLNGRDERIMQFVELANRPKTNGNIRTPTAPLVIQMGNLNPNYYSITIENEGYAGNGVDGTLTEIQFIKLCWLHKYIQSQVKLAYGITIPLNSHQVIGHFQIDSEGKSRCPGVNFPWTRLYAELAIADTMELTAYEERLDYLQSQSGRRATAYAFAERIDDLGKRLTDPKWGAESRRKVMLLAPAITATAGDASTAESIVARVTDLYKKALSGNFGDEATRKLLLIASEAKEKGLLP